MKIFYSENNVNYSSYTFNYAIYCLKEKQAELPQIYNKGFLPYSANTALTKDIFYLARSLRVDLENFVDSSENRRVARKAAELNIEIKCTPKNEFEITEEFIRFCSDYAADRFSGNSMSKERFEYVLSRDITTHIISFHNNENTFGYLLACKEGDMLHYWFAFFDTEYLRSHSLGKWMMWRTIVWAKEQGLAHIYLGTCYGTHSLYKVRDFKSIQFFVGVKWNHNVKQLKQLCKTDTEELQTDRFKLMKEQEVFLENL